MSEDFFAQPILNSPYRRPDRHWEMDTTGQPTQQIVHRRRQADFITPIPKPRKRKSRQGQLNLQDDESFTQENTHYALSQLINELRVVVDDWRSLPDPATWKVSPETARLLQHWRNHDFQSVRPFFCQLEAVETAIWLAEVAPKSGRIGKRFIDYLQTANENANPGLSRLALKLATGAGKTTVMAMLIAWQTVNAVRHPGSRLFTTGFLIVTPGITIRDRLRVLKPSDPDSYFRTRELVPSDMLPDLGRAQIVITNFHAFKLRNRIELSAGGRALLQGRGEALNTLETEGQMLQRVMPELMGMKNVCVINDEAHHCYRERPQSEGDDAAETLKGEERREAEENNAAARLWISGIETVTRRLGTRHVYDLSATPFFLSGSGYNEGTLFPWTMSDFSLMDAIECGIVKLPRVPVADNIPGDEMPRFRKLWDNIRDRMPKRGRGNSGPLDPLSIPVELQTALDALYGHYTKTFELWRDAGVRVPPCFIIVCNNTSTSKLVYDYISGFQQTQRNGTTIVQPGRLPLFRNFDDNGQPLARPRTLLIDSQQLESGEALDSGFRDLAADELERFRREIIERTGDARAADQIDDATVLREVMNTVGKEGRLGETIRCVVSVSMLTEGWDANTVTHILGVRAFGTQLLCEQVIGRALRRSSYDLNEDGLFNAEYADVLGIPFDFNSRPVVARPQAARETIRIHAVRPERDDCEIRFPRVLGYRVELPNEQLDATFNEDSVLHLTPSLVGPTVTQNSAIIGENVDLRLDHLQDVRPSTLMYKLSKRLLETRFRDADGETEHYLFGSLKRITRRWLDECLKCDGGSQPGQLMYQELSEMACERIMAGINRRYVEEQSVRAVLDPYNPVGSSACVRLNSSKTDRWETRPDRCHVNWAIMDSDWEAEFCRVVENHPRVLAYVKNHGLDFEVPYLMGGVARSYRPDFIVKLDDGHGPDDPLFLIVEIKGYRGEDAKVKKETMEVYWVPGVNRVGRFGRWAFAEFGDVFAMEADFRSQVDARVAEMIERQLAVAVC